MSNAPAPAAAAAAVPPAPEGSKGGSKLVIILIAAIVATAGVAGAGAFWYLHKPETAEAKPKPKASSRGLVKFQPFVANLADPGGSRFVRATVQLVVESPKLAEEAEKNPVLLMQARSEILELLAQQTAAELVTPEGKTKLKEAILEHVKESLEEVKVVDVLFSDFVVQF
jgi:flagellar protein FliL